MNDEEQQPPAIANRNRMFGEGMIHGQVEPPQSLQEEASRFNASVPTEYRPSGSLNGMAQDQYENTLGGSFKPMNGSALDTWSTKRYFSPAE